MPPQGNSAIHMKFLATYNISYCVFMQKNNCYTQLGTIAAYYIILSQSCGANIRTELVINVAVNALVPNGPTVSTGRTLTTTDVYHIVWAAANVELYFCYPILQFNEADEISQYFEVFWRVDTHHGNYATVTMLPSIDAPINFMSMVHWAHFYTT